MCLESQWEVANAAGDLVALAHTILGHVLSLMRPPGVISICLELAQTCHCATTGQQDVESPALHKAVGRHLLEAHLGEDLAELRPDLQAEWLWTVSPVLQLALDG